MSWAHIIHNPQSSYGQKNIQTYVNHECEVDYTWLSISQQNYENIKNKDMRIKHHLLVTTTGRINTTTRPTIKHNYHQLLKINKMIQLNLS